MVAADVAPIDRSDLSTAPMDDPDAVRARDVLLRTNRYCLSVWWRERGFAARPDQRFDLGGTDELTVRPVAAVALGLASSLATGAYDEDVVGHPTEVARARTVRLVSSLAAGHRVRAGESGWGDGWQTALWAAYTGLAGWLLWDHLPRATRTDLRLLIAHEADNFLEYEVPYHRDRQGRVLTPGDTKAEENSWNARLVHLATVMLPGHDHVAGWTSAALELLISAYARPTDVDSDRVLHGRSLSSWLGGSNAEPNGLLVNHNRIHPDYMVVPHHSGVALQGLLADRPVPEAALLNLDVVYSALVDVEFEAPPYAEPGGTIYIDGSGDIYYPQGSSWGTRRRIHFMLQDVQARALGFDRSASTPAVTWERLHTTAVLEMMDRFDDGRVYGAEDEFRSSQREEAAAERAGQAYLTKWLTAQRPVRLSDDPVETTAGG